jgi:hypothetical protein
VISVTTRIDVKSRASTASVCIRRVTATTDRLHRWRSSTPGVAARRAIACDSSPDFLGRLATALPVRRVCCCRFGERENLRRRARSDIAKVTQAQAVGYATYLGGRSTSRQLGDYYGRALRASRGREQLCWQGASSTDEQRKPRGSSAPKWVRRCAGAGPGSVEHAPCRFSSQSNPQPGRPSRGEGAR